MATENIIMACVKNGGDRQVLHEQIRVHSMEAARQVKMEGTKNDLIDRIASDTTFGLSKTELNELLNVKAFIGRAPEQVREFVKEWVEPLINRAEYLGKHKHSNLTV